MNGPSVAARLNQLELRFAAACARAGRARGDVRLLAVSKLQDVALMREAWAVGQRAFGENYAQEAVAKVNAWPADLAVEWHFIGRVQSNKVRGLANKFAVIHSVDRFEIAERLDRATTTRQNIFIQFNVANEGSKAGADVGEVRDLVARVAAECPRLRVLGLMVMPPLSEDAEATRPFFRAARRLLDDLRAEFSPHPLDQLSMGTSGDFEVAIEEGATWVRIGTDVFGPRVGK